MASITLTVRHGPRVERESFDGIDAALAGLRKRAEAIRAEGPLEGVKMIREFEPAQRVAARLELSTGGFLRGREAGLDVMGDGRLVPYAGSLRKRRLEPGGDEVSYEAIREALR